MLGAIFAILCLISAVGAIFTGRVGELSPAVFDGATRAVELTLTLIGMTTLWSGILEILREAGAIDRLARLLRPILRLLFPESARSGRLPEASVAFLAATLLGIGNASTPLGLAAMKELQREGSDAISGDAATLVVLACSSVSILPTTLLTLRHAAGAALEYELLPAIWGVGTLGAMVGVAAVKLLARCFK